MLSSVASAALYVLGALATAQSIVHEGGWREAAADKRMAVVVGLSIVLWPVFVVCTTWLAVRGLIRARAREAKP